LQQSPTEQKQTTPKPVNSGPHQHMLWLVG